MKIRIKLIGIVLCAMAFHSCDVEADMHSEIVPEEFFKTDAQIEAAAAAAYTPLYGYWGHHDLADLTTDQSTVPIRSNNGWDDGGVWPRLMQHDFDPNGHHFNNEWNRFATGISATNRLIEIFTENIGQDAPAVYELRTLRAFYFFKLLHSFGNIPIETGFSDADPEPSQVPASEAFEFIEAELLASLEHLSQDKANTYGKVNKWVGYTILAKLYLNAEVIMGVAHWEEAAQAADVVIQSGAYSLESGYFANFKTNNEGSSENIFVVPYERGLANGFGIYFSALTQSVHGTLGGAQGSYGGYSIQEDFYNAYQQNDLRKGMFIVGQQYTIEAGPSFSDEIGFYYTNPSEDLRLNNCIEDWDNFATQPNLQEQIESGCNVIITPGYQELGGRYLYKNGARYGKFQYPLGTAGDISVDFPIYRYADVLLMRAEALWRQNKADAQAVALVNEVRARAGVEPLTTLSEDDLYWEFKKELAMENHARETTLRFGHWEDDWFLRDGNKEEFRRIFPIPADQLRANANLVQNPGY